MIATAGFSVSGGPGKGERSGSAPSTVSAVCALSLPVGKTDVTETGAEAGEC